MIINNCKFQRTQVPLVLAYGITCHAAQGITKETVIIDMGKTGRKHGLFFVPLSRAKKLYLKEFRPSYVYCDPKVTAEMHRLSTQARMRARIYKL